MSESIDQRLASDSTGKYPMDGLRYLVGGYDEEAPEMFYDCEGPVEAAMRQMRFLGYSPQRGRDELAELLSMDLSDWDLDRRTLRGGLPAGRSAHAFLRYMLTRIDLELANPAPRDSDVGWVDYQNQPMAHRSWFHDKATADTATTLVLRANEQRFRSWAADQAGVQRLWLAADLDRSIGRVFPQPRLAQRQAQEPDPPPIDASTCVTVLRMDAGSGRPVILTSYPELALDPAVRERWPDLTLLLGSFFNQDCVQLYNGFWGAEDTFHQITSPEVIARVRDSLADLLAAAPTHDELKPILHSLGSCTMPDDTVRWVTGLHRRMVEFDWHVEPVFPTRDDLGKPGAPPRPSSWTYIPRRPDAPPPPTDVDRTRGRH